MSIYRGAGGASDATDDSTVNAVAGYASAAAASATSAANSATNAATSATAASTSASGAATQVSLATTQAGNAASSAASAASSVTSAAAQASAASTSASAASSSASDASTNASAASTSATNAANSATAASGSATTASTQATNSAASAASALAIYGNTTAMNNAVTASQTAATNAATSASSAATSAANALASSGDASVYASNANASYVAAAASASAAAASLAGFDGNVVAAITAASSASASASAAASSATNSADSAVQAASSASSATAIVLGTASTRASIRPSLLLDFAKTRTLDPRVTFTRASTATFYDTNTATVAEQNLVTYSQEFDNAAWTKAATSVTTNVIAGPDSSTASASLLTADGTANIHYITHAGVASTTGKTFSIYLKAGTNNFAQIYFASSSLAFANFDLSAGTVGSVGSTQTASIVSVGGGWYRCIVASASTVISAPRVVIVSSSTAAVAESNSLTTNIYMWGAQAEYRQFATAYVQTSSQTAAYYIPVLQTAASGAARFDCDPISRQSLGLLIEEARTNLLTYSSEYDNAVWTKNNTVVAVNQMIAPDGTLTADIVAADAVNTTHSIQQSFSAVSGTNYTASVFVRKYNGPQYVQLMLTGTTNLSAYFDFFTREFSNVSGGATVGYADVGNGWYRIWITRAADSTSTQNFVISSYDTLGTSYVGNSFVGQVYWGGQVETGAFPTSYIPTTSAQVTRAADSFTMSGTSFSNWYNHAEGTISVTAVNKGVVSDTTLYSIDDGTTGQTNTIDVRYTGFGVATRSRSRANSVTDVDIQSSLFDFGTQQQFSFGYKLNDFAASISGATASTDSVGILPITLMTRFRLGARGTGIPITQLYVSRFAYYPERLSNTELQGITS